MQTSNQLRKVPHEAKPSSRVSVRVPSWKKINTHSGNIFILTQMTVRIPDSPAPGTKIPNVNPSVPLPHPFTDSSGAAPVFVLATSVLSKRVQVANLLHDKTDLELLGSGRHYVNEMTGDSLFGTPNPPLGTISTALDAFELLISEAESFGHAKVEERDAKREEVLNLLGDLSNYVETVANDPANAALGPVAVIEAAGMRAKTYTAPGKQQFRVKAGKFHGEIDCTAASTGGDGTHEWQWRLAGGDDDSWSETFPTRKASITFTGLERGAIIIVRHRVVASNHHAIDWEYSSSVVVP